MSMNSFYIRNMLLQYDRQLVTARRLARYQLALRGSDSGNEPAIPPDVKRKVMVERVAREIFENLIVAGSENPVVDEIRNELDSLFGERFVFRYPPTTLDVQVLKERGGQLVEVSPEDKGEILDRLWDITIARVDATML